LALGDFDGEMIERFLGQAGPAARWLEDNSALEWELLPYPDYHCEMPGGMTVGGRSLAACLVQPRADVAELLRPALSWRAPVTHLEVVSNTVDPDVIAQRRADGTATMGQGMIAALLTTCLDEGIDVRVNTRAVELIEDAGNVVGVRAEDESGTVEFPGRVILASGGFERDPALSKAFLRIPAPAQTVGPGAIGDGLRMAMSAGAELGSMSEAWWALTIHVPGDDIGQGGSRGSDGLINSAHSVILLDGLFPLPRSNHCRVEEVIAMLDGVADGFLQLLPDDLPLICLGFAVAGIVLCGQPLHLFQSDGPAAAIVAFKQRRVFSFQYRH